MVKKREFLVVGLGLFGTSVATALKKSGCQVLAVDKDEDRVREVLGEVTHAVVADVTDPEQLEDLGVKDYDAAIIAIGTDLETSILATILIKETGIPFVLAKASSALQARVLKKVGADKIVFPEEEMGVHVAANLTVGNFFAAVELSATHSIMELDALPEWEGKTLKECDLRKKYGINVVGIRKGEDLEMNPGPESRIGHNDIVVAIGKNDVLTSLAAK